MPELRLIISVGFLVTFVIVFVLFQMYINPELKTVNHP